MAIGHVEVEAPTRRISAARLAKSADYREVEHLSIADLCK